MVDLLVSYKRRKIPNFLASQSLGGGGYIFNFQFYIPASRRFVRASTLFLCGERCYRGEEDEDRCVN